MKKVIRLLNYLKKNWFYVLVLIGISLFFIILKKYYSNTLHDFDNNIYKIISKYKCNTLTNIFKFISHLCGPITIIVALFLILLFGKHKSYDRYIVLISSCAFILNYIIKFICKRPRPEDINIIVETGYSFPSSHAMVSVAFYGFIAYFIYKSNISKNKKIILITSLILLAFLIGLSRIYLGVHYASDVCAGFAISLSYTILFIRIISKRRLKF